MSPPSGILETVAEQLLDVAQACQAGELAGKERQSRVGDGADQRQVGPVDENRSCLVQIAEIVDAQGGAGDRKVGHRLTGRRQTDQGIVGPGRVDEVAGEADQ